MDKIAKALEKLSAAERKAVQGILDLLKIGKLSGMDTVKLKGYQGIFRAHKGKIRIIYRVTSDNDVTLLAIERRSDNTYNQLD